MIEYYGIERCPSVSVNDFHYILKMFCLSNIKMHYSYKDGQNSCGPKGIKVYVLYMRIKEHVDKRDIKNLVIQNKLGKYSIVTSVHQLSSTFLSLILFIIGLNPTVYLIFFAHFL